MDLEDYLFKSDMFIIMDSLLDSYFFIVGLRYVAKISFFFMYFIFSLTFFWESPKVW